MILEFRRRIRQMESSYKPKGSSYAVSWFRHEKDLRWRRGRNILAWRVISVGTIKHTCKSGQQHVYVN